MFTTSLPATPMFGLRREIDRLFDETFSRNGTPHATWAPATDVREDDKAITFEMDLPGISPDKVEVTTDDGMLTVKGEKAVAPQAQDSDIRWHVTERVHGAFQRSFQLRGAIDDTAISASFANGVLTIRVPKAALPQPTRVKINAE